MVVSVILVQLRQLGHGCIIWEWMRRTGAGLKLDAWQIDRLLAQLTCQHKVHPRRLVERIDPGMNCASLYADISSFHCDHDVVVQVAEVLCQY
jgi:hypothetical protein